MKTEIKRFCSAVAVALCLVGAAFAEGEPSWGCVQFEGGATEPLTKVNASGEAVLADADLGGTPVAIQFTNTLGGAALPVGGIVLSDKTIRFEGTVPLQADGTNSAFRLTDGDWTFKGLTFKGVGETKKAVYDGGAIDCLGGTLTLADCTFTNLMTHFTGGAVSARELTGNMLVTNCVFSDNKARPINGYGGALYASAAAGEDDVLLDVVDCRFAKNEAENGGAICTLVISSDNEKPVELVIRDGANGTSFGKNRAIYEGGAVFAEGPVRIEGSNTLFRSNWAGFGGGAVCLTGVQGDFTPVTLTVTNGVVFADNETSTNVTWTAGGAIAVMPEGCKLEVYRAVFTNNCAKTSRNASPGSQPQPALGGAIYTGDNVTNLFWKTAFVGNDANAGDKQTVWCYGGAISVAGGATTVDTCVFDCGTSANKYCYGNGIDFNETEAQLINSTFRRGQVEAVSTYNGSLAVTNCVLVGNGLDAGSGIDAYLEGTTEFSIAYSAYGKIARDATATVVANDFNLTNRTTAIYAGSTLHLDGSGFNPVAGLGLRQVGVTDFVDTGYGTLAYGFSMGAYETPTVQLLVKLDGSKIYDTTAASNGCAWTWNLCTNDVDVAWDDLGDVAKAFVITNWQFGAAEVGTYASTNAAPQDIVAGVEGKGDAVWKMRVEWYRTLLDFLYTGTIRKMGDVVVIYDPKEFEWTGGEVKPGETGIGKVIVSNTVDNVILPASEYRLEWDKNVDPTADAKLIVVCTNNYEFIETNVFAITAYLTEYFLDGVQDPGVVTNGALSASNAVAVISVPMGYCLDYQNSTTNATVYGFGQGPEAGDPDVTTLKVLYETDVVGTDPTNPNTGDGVPDKYQKKVLFATVNGYWDDCQNGHDRYVWVTLTNETPSAKGKTGEGTWAADGKCTLAYVPAVGQKPFERFAKESAKPGTWNCGSSPVGQVVTADSFPVFFYAPASRTIEPREEKGQTPVFMSLMTAVAAAPREEPVDVNGLRNALSITGFTIGEAGEIAGLVEAQVVDSETGKPLAAMELANTRIEILGVENLGDEWQKIAEVTTDADGSWVVERITTRRSGGPSATKDFRTARDGSAWEIGSATFNPSFFTVRLATAE